MTELVIYWVLFSVLVCYWAHIMGKSVLWCIIGCILFTPLAVAFYYLRQQKRL